MMGFGPKGWGWQLLGATGMTVLVSVTAFAIGMVLGAISAIAKISGGIAARSMADAYTTILRGVPDLVIIYLLYFGGSAMVTSFWRLFGYEGFVGTNAFLAGALAVGVISGAYQGEVYRGAFGAIAKGEIEAARACGMSGFLIFRRIIVPQVLRYAVPGLGNVWQLVLKESALVSVTGLTEILRMTQIGAGSTRKPFWFFMTAAALYLVLTTISTFAFERAEARATRGMRRA